MELEITPNAECVKPTMKQLFTLFLSALNLKKNRNSDLTGWKGLCIAIFVERKPLMFPRNGANTNIYFYRK